MCPSLTFPLPPLSQQRQRKSSPQQEVLVEVVMCVGGKQGQEWSLTQDGAVTQSGAVTPGGVAAEGAGCLTVLAHDDARVFVQECQAGPKQRWLRQGRRLQHAASGMCLDSASNEGALVLPCRDSLLSQQWDFSVELQALTTL